MWLEDAGEPLPLDAQLHAVGVAHHGHVHVHRCRRRVATVNFQQHTKTHAFPVRDACPCLPLGHGRHGFNLNDHDSTDHLLQRFDSSPRPDEDTHLRTLAQSSQCQVCFDLVMKVRMEG